MPGIDIQKVRFVVPSPDSSSHTLYLENGYIVRISPVSGKVLSVAELPTQQQIEAKVKRTKRAVVG